MSIAQSIRAQIPPIHPEGYPFIGGFALVSLILFWIWSPLGWIGTLLTVWCALFFRDPVRVTPVRDGIVVAPADGRVSLVTQVLPAAGDRAKDLGVISVASSAGQALAPAVAAPLVTYAGGYPALYFCVAGILLLGAASVWRIRSVR